METPELNFQEILAKVKKTKIPIVTYPSVATDFLGVSRRGWRVVELINEMLDEYDVICEPEFGRAWFYGQIEIKPKPKISAGKNNDDIKDLDPTPRLSLLNAANLNKAKGSGPGLISVNRETPLSEAITIMLLNDFSQLPIMSSPRNVEGIVSWKSIGRALSLGKNCKSVFECKDEVVILKYDDPLFKAVGVVLSNEVVLVQQRDKTITGIVTATDIGHQFISMAEPFLIIEQIENHIRKLLHQKFNSDELTFTLPKEDKVREIKSLADLNFGEYIMILQDPKKFEKLEINFDRRLIIQQLEEVRKIRNDVMHFDPDGITEENLELLRKTATFLQTISNTIN